MPLAAAGRPCGNPHRRTATTRCRAATASADRRTTTAVSASSRPTWSTSSWPPSRKNGRSSGSITGPTSSRVSSAGSRARSPGAGALDVLRNGVKDSGCKFRLAYFRPASGLNEELQRLHAANLFAVVRQLRYSEQGRAEPRPRALPQRHPPLHGRAQESAQRPGRPGRDPAVSDRPRSARAAPRLRALPRPLRRGPPIRCS